MRSACLCVQLEADKLTAVFVPAGKGELDRVVMQGDPARLAEELRAFAARHAKSCPRVIGLLLRRSVLLMTMDLPTRDPGEARAMARLQFVRSTPHAQEEMVVDAVPLSFESSRRATFSCAMVTRMTLGPLMAILSKAGLVARQVAVADLGQIKDRRDLVRVLDRGEGLFDLRDELERNTVQRRDMVREGRLMAALFAAAAVIFILADAVILGSKCRKLAQLNRGLSVIAVETTDLKQRRERIDQRRDSLGHSVVFPVLARALSDAIPARVRLSQLAFGPDRLISLQGVGATIEDVGAFRDALRGEDVCAEVEIMGLDKRPMGATEEVSFTLSCPWKGI